MSDRAEGIMRNVFIGVLIALCSGSIGFGTSQMAIATQVQNNKNNIHHLHESDDLLRKEILDERTRTDQRIFALANLVQKIIDQNSELIVLVKSQNDLLSRQVRP